VRLDDSNDERVGNALSAVAEYASSTSSSSSISPAAMAMTAAAALSYAFDNADADDDDDDDADDMPLVPSRAQESRLAPKPEPTPALKAGRTLLVDAGR
jgi:hypothetical protein